MKTLLLGREIAYEDRGEGDAILFLHAFPLNQSMWDPQAAALADAFRILRFDLPGFGASPPGNSPLTIEGIADLGAALLDSRKVERAVICGCSMGGYAALAFAARHPARLSGLVLADTRAGADTPEGRQARAEMAERVRREGLPAVREAMIPRLLAPRTCERRPEIVARVEGMIGAATVDGIVAALGALASRPDRRGDLASIAAPTLVVCGREDSLTPPAESEAMHARIPASKLALLDGAGHLPNLEAEAEFNGALAAFLNEIAPA